MKFNLKLKTTVKTGNIIIAVLPSAVFMVEIQID